MKSLVALWARVSLYLGDVRWLSGNPTLPPLTLPNSPLYIAAGFSSLPRGYEVFSGGACWA